MIRSKHLIIFLLILSGCKAVYTGYTNKINLPITEDKSIYIQTDQTQTDITHIVSPLRTELVAKGYKIAENQDQAVYIMQLQLIEFGIEPKKGKQSGLAGGTGLIVGDSLGGATGGIVGGVLGTFLEGPRGVPFNIKIDVNICSNTTESQQTTVAAWARVKNKNEEVNVRKVVSTKIAAKIAALMP